jgi:hypothetical protein
MGHDRGALEPEGVQDSREFVVATPLESCHVDPCGMSTTHEIEGDGTARG